MSNPKGPSKRVLYAITLFAVLVVGGLAAYVKLTPADKVPADQHRDQLSQRAEPKVDITTKRSGSEVTDVFVFTPKQEGDVAATFERKLVPVPAGEDAKVFAVNAFLQASKIVEPTARLLAVDVEDGVAKLSFNAAFEGGYGSGDEAVLIEGLQRTLGQFEGITKIEVFADGKPLDSLGNVELAGGLDVRRPE